MVGSDAGKVNEGRFTFGLKISEWDGWIVVTRVENCFWTKVRRASGGIFKKGKPWAMLMDLSKENLETSKRICYRLKGTIEGIFFWSTKMVKRKSLIYPRNNPKEISVGSQTLPFVVFDKKVSFFQKNSVILRYFWVKQIFQNINFLFRWPLLFHILWTLTLDISNWFLSNKVSKSVKDLQLYWKTKFLVGILCKICKEYLVYLREKFFSAVFTVWQRPLKNIFMRCAEGKIPFVFFH